MTGQNLEFSHETIIACATAEHLRTALAVIRLSGQDLKPEEWGTFNFPSGPIEPRRSYFSYFYQPQCLSDVVGQKDDLVKPDLEIFNPIEATSERSLIKIDEVLVTKFFGPSSFTGEDIVEISCHGNPVIIAKILEILLKVVPFARLAKPGEFHLRAYQHGKLGVLDIETKELILNSNSLPLVQQGLNFFNSDIFKSYEHLQFQLNRHQTQLDLALDFAEDVGAAQVIAGLRQSYVELRSVFFDLRQRLNLPLELLNRPRVLLLGRPNAGKSSIFNFLVNKNRAIVSSVAGTTRDYLEEYVAVNGQHFIITDTAGLRDTSDRIELEGIRLAKQLAGESILLVLLIDIRSTLTDLKVLLSELNSLSDGLGGKEGSKSRYIPVAIVFSHIDSLKSQDFNLNALNENKISDFTDGEIVEFVNNAFLESMSQSSLQLSKILFSDCKAIISPNLKDVANFFSRSTQSQSAYSGPQELLNLFYQVFIDLKPSDQIVMMRHRIVIQKMLEVFDEYSRWSNHFECIENGFSSSSLETSFGIDLGVASQYSVSLREFASELFGEVLIDDHLNQIFEKFCIGK